MVQYISTFSSGGHFEQSRIICAIMVEGMSRNNPVKLYLPVVKDDKLFKEVSIF